MTATSILIVTNEQDVGADFLVHELAAREVPVVRLNTERAPTWRLSLQPGETWRCQGPRRSLSSEACLGVWWRRPELPRTDGSASAAAEAIADQWRAFLSALATVPGPFWISDPSAIHRAENKARQLALGAEVGLKVPETLWTTDAAQAADFIDAAGGEAVVKSIASAWWEDAGRGKFVFAQSVTARDLPGPAQIAAAPVCFQRRIWPKRDVRVTVVGARCYAAVHEPADGPAVLDWRLGDQSGWVPYELADDVALACARVTSKLGLAFAGIDLAVDDVGNPWFLELNPNGEWGWLQKAGLPIAEAIADALTLHG